MKPKPKTPARPQRATHSPAGRSEPTAGNKTEAVYDAALVRRFNGGDESAFTEIIQRYYPRIHALADRTLHNHGDAEEVAQDTFIRAHRGLATFRGDSSLAVWLHRIGLNLARNRYWFYARRQRHATLSLDLPVAEGSNVPLVDLLSGDTDDPRSESIAGEFVTFLAECMDKLAPAQAEILKMRTKLNLSYEQIASRLGVTVGTVKNRISRAREKLRELMRQGSA